MELLDKVFIYKNQQGDRILCHSEKIDTIQQELINLHPERVDELTTEEEVNYLYRLAFNGTGKEYRQICRWVGRVLEKRDDLAYWDFHITMGRIDLSSNESDINWCKSVIRRAIEAEPIEE